MNLKNFFVMFAHHNYRHNYKIENETFMLNIFFNNLNTKDLIKNLFSNVKSKANCRNIEIYMVNGITIPSDIKELLSKGDNIKVHGGDEHLRIDGLKYSHDNLTLININKNGNDYVLYDTSKCKFLLLTKEAMVGYNLIRVIREIYLRECQNNNYLTIHASAVVDSKKEGILFLGKKGSGKSTLMCEFLKNNLYSYLDNDRVLIALKDNNVWAYSLSTVIRLGYGTISRFKDIFQETTDNKNIYEKVSFSRDVFLKKIKCNGEVKAVINKIIFPHIIIDKTPLQIYTTSIEEYKKLLNENINPLHEEEHPDWLELLRINDEEYNKNKFEIINTLSKTVESTMVSLGIDNIDEHDIKCIVKNNK